MYTSLVTVLKGFCVCLANYHLPIILELEDQRTERNNSKSSFLWVDPSIGL